MRWHVVDQSVTRLTLTAPGPFGTIWFVRREKLLSEFRTACLPSGHPARYFRTDGVNAQPSESCAGFSPSAEAARCGHALLGRVGFIHAMGNRRMSPGPVHAIHRAFLEWPRKDSSGQQPHPVLFWQGNPRQDAVEGRSCNTEHIRRSALVAPAVFQHLQEMTLLNSFHRK